MGEREPRWTAARKRALVSLVCLVAAALPISPARAEPLPEPHAAAPPVLTLEAAVGWALQHNPELTALRQQYGVAEAGVVIARTYPFNPFFYSRTTYVEGPPGTLTDEFPVQGGVFMQVEVCGQKKFREQAASAALCRTEWEIAFQELVLAVRVTRAFQTVLYRQDKLRLVEDTIRLNQQVVDQVGQLVSQGKLRAADLIVARTELSANRAQLSPARTTLNTALADLYRGLGVTCAALRIQGNLDSPACAADGKALLDKALQRADWQARRLAVDEAEARYKLQVADRFGNPTVGPFFERDLTSDNYYGIQANLPIPIFNLRRGEIQQRLAEKQRAVMDLQSTEVLIQQDVQAALTRLTSAREGVQIYQTDVLPNTRAGLENMQKLFQASEADILRIIDLQRKLLQAQSGYLDALWEINQAQDDLAAAVGDPTLAFAACPATPAPINQLPKR